MDSQFLCEIGSSEPIDRVMSVLNLESGTILADTVFDSFLKHLICALRQKMGDRDQLDEVTDAVELYLFQQKFDGQSLLANDRRTNNKLGGNLKECPIAAYLVQDALYVGGEPEKVKKYSAWQAFVTATIFSNKSFTEKQTKKYERVCTELRRAAKDGERANVLLGLPELVVNEGVVDSTLEERLSDPSYLSKFGEKSKDSISALRWLLEQSKQLSALSQPSSAWSFNPISAVRLSSSKIEMEEEAEAGLIGVGEMHIVESDSIIEIEPYYDYQDDSLDIEAILGDEDIAQSSDGLLRHSSEARAVRSSYWLRRTQRASLVDGNLLDEFDKAIFSGWLRRELKGQFIGGEDKFAFVLGLSFFFGKSVKDVTRMRHGDKHDLSSLGYCKKVLLPDDGFVPKEEGASLYYPTTNQIQLPFVCCLEDWFNCNLNESYEGKTLSEIFGLSPKEILEGTKNALKKLRQEHRKTRIDLRKLSSHLATETSAITRDPVSVYFLTGKETDKPPVTSYYQVMTVDQLLGVYKEVISSMYFE